MLLKLCRYQQFFDVDTSDVIQRMADSLKGPLMPNFLDIIRSNPDLYALSTKLLSRWPVGIVSEIQTIQVWSILGGYNSDLHHGSYW